MIKKEREKQILRKLTENGVIDVQTIAKLCHVSEITIRRDFEQLEKEGKLIRTHGGATFALNSFKNFGFNEKANYNKQKKIRICQKASEYIKENDVIYVDCGSTVFHLTSFIGKIKNLKVVTNSIPVISVLMNFTNIKAYLIGGELDKERQALYGPMSEMAINSYRATKAFIGAAGVSISQGLSSLDEKEANTTVNMAQNADLVFLLADSEKINKIAFVNYAKITLVDYLITDNEVPESFMNECIENNIKLIIA
jgi:DeoR family fructose operon transcriptional repressor